MDNTYLSISTDDLSAYDPGEYENTVVFQACGRGRYQLTSLDGSYSFDKDSFSDKETKKELFGVFYDILGYMYEEHLNKLAVLMIFSSEDSDSGLLQEWLDTLRAEIVDQIANGPFRNHVSVVDFFYDWRCGSHIEPVIRKKLSLKTIVKKILNETISEEDTKPLFVEYLNKMYAESAKREITSGRFEIMKGSNFDKTVNRYKQTINTEIISYTDSKDKLQNIKKGKSLEPNRILILLLAYKLKMTDEQTRRLFSYGDLIYDAQSYEEHYIMRFIEERLYDYDEKEMNKVLEEFGYDSIYDVAGFCLDD